MFFWIRWMRYLMSGVISKMDQAVIKYYRRLLKENFPNSGEIADPSMFLEADGKKTYLCGEIGNYMQLFLQVEGGRIAEIKYLCFCEPRANVAVEVLCNLVRGKTLEETALLTEEPFYQIIDSSEEELQKKVRGLLELLHEGIASYRSFNQRFN